MDLACESMAQCPAYSRHSETLSTLPILSYFVPVAQPGSPEQSPLMPHVCICRNSESHLERGTSHGYQSPSSVQGVVCYTE